MLSYVMLLSVRLSEHMSSVALSQISTISVTSRISNSNSLQQNVNRGLISVEISALCSAPTSEK